MRIAFLNTLYLPYGVAGAETTLRLLARGLAERGHDCAIVTLGPGRRETEGQVDGIPVHYLPLANLFWPHGGRRFETLRPAFQAIDAYNPIMRRRLARRLRALRPDVLHCHNLLGFSVGAWAAAQDAGVPVVQTLHDYYVTCPRSAMWRLATGNCRRQCPECRLLSLPRRTLSRLPYAVTSVSRRVIERVTAAGVFTDASRVRIIRGNNLPPETPGPSLFNDRCVGNGAMLRLGFLGRLDRLKGLENLLDALVGLPAGRVSLCIAGRGAEDYMAALRARCPPGQDVRFLGHMKPDGFFREIDLLVISSVWEDPFPRVFHEALAHGVPSLVSPLGGLPEAVAHGRNGFVAGAATATALREALQNLLDRGWDRAAMRQNCLKAADDYGATHITGQYEAVLQAAAARTMRLPEGCGNSWP